MTRGLVGPSGKTALVEGSRNAVLSVNFDGGSANMAVALLSTDGGASPNVQFLQDMAGTLYYTVFGPKMSSMMFTCSDPLELCSKGSILKADDILQTLTQRIARRELPQGTMVYGKSVFRGYVYQVDLKTSTNNPIFSVTIIGTFV